MTWKLKDYVFAAFMTIGMVVASLITVPLAAGIPLPAARTIAWAPLGGIFLTLGMARLQNRGSIALIIAPMALLFSPIPPPFILTSFLVIAVLVAESVMFAAGGWRSRISRLFGNMLFFGTFALAAALIGARVLGGGFADWLTTPWIIIPSTLLAAGAGAVGWWLGEQVIRQLQRAGKLEVDS